MRCYTGNLDDFCLYKRYLMYLMYPVIPRGVGCELYMINAIFMNKVGVFYAIMFLIPTSISSNSSVYL
ncbi:uncharacterized protein F4822DRAFT_414475 [Hypoxylon trugodes]|uniref:uncharacterized protein n=1 Tax=Hypoxylon trugodes TaxID=326681 RepID=UPI00219A5B4F|nr:uncharacterized protein F4822DRAFT_414475 [Hypoxylon trugodes]KAI1385924.1 hypothetical protein F4822DRAFT_414475 [Hypoxylon trugodes]